MKMEKKDYLIIISLFLLAFFIRTAGVANVSLYSDEWWYWINTNKILVDNFVPRADVFSYSPPFLSYIGSIFTLLFDGDLKVLRMISVIFGSLTVPILYLFGGAMYDRKTGLISALFLCFSTYHILYSRLFMLEALTLFFITGFLYLFWMSLVHNNNKNIAYSCIAGAMLGLAIDAKWISFILLPVSLTYILWTSGFKLKALFDKRVILMLFFAFLFFLPMLISLFYTGVGFDGILFYIDEKFKKESAVTTRVGSLSLDVLIFKGIDNISSILSYGSDLLISSLIANAVFILFIIVIFFYLHDFLYGEKKSSFLMIPFFYLFLFVLISAPHMHYLIYMFPFYFVMLSHIFLISIEKIRTENKKKNILRFFIIILTTIMLFSYFITGATSYYWDKGDYHPWAKEALDYIGSDILKKGYEERILIGTFTALKEPVSRPLYLSNLNASTIRILKDAGTYSNKLSEVDLEKISKLKPIYLIVAEPQYGYVQGNAQILKDYEVVSYIHTYPVEAKILRRRYFQQQEQLLFMNRTDLKSSRDIFRQSIPNIMEIGKTYIALVRVSNSGNIRTNVTINVYSDEFKLFVDDSQRKVTLEEGSTKILKFKLLPFKESAGVFPMIPITVDISEFDETGNYIILDSFTEFISRIEK